MSSRQALAGDFVTLRRPSLHSPGGPWSPGRPGGPGRYALEASTLLSVMYLPRSVALLGSRAICREKRDLGQEATAPLPGRFLALALLTLFAEAAKPFRDHFSLYLSQLGLKGSAEILPQNPEAF